MIILNVLFIVAFMVVLLGSGGLLVIAPEKVVSWLRQQSQGSKVLQLNPFLSRSWYPHVFAHDGLVRVDICSCDCPGAYRVLALRLS